MAATPRPGSTTTDSSHHRQWQGTGQARPSSQPLADADADDHYQLLAVPYTASAIEITRAYRAAMKHVHPDRQRPEGRAGAEEQARRLNRAYAVLSKPSQRQVYDRAIRARVVQDQLMGRYVGGFHVPQTDGPDPLARHLRRDLTPGERRAQRRADREAMVSIVVVFGGITLAVVALLLLWATVQSLVGAVF